MTDEKELAAWIFVSSLIAIPAVFMLSLLTAIDLVSWYVD